MPKFQAVKVATPGSQKWSQSPGRGRPRKAKERRKGTIRKGNYRDKYAQLAMDQAIEAVKDKRMGVREAAKAFKVPRQGCEIVVQYWYSA